MKKLLTICLLLLASQVYAEWKYLSAHPDGVKYYYDSEKINNQGRYVTFWMLINHPKINKYGLLSEKHKYKVDCKKFRVKILVVYDYSTKMGQGKPIGTPQLPDKWVKVPKFSFVGTAMEKLCR
jgi:hypothetical protein